MGGPIMKGSYGNMQHQYSANSNTRKRWNVYLVTLIILLLFGSAVLGLMSIHRLRDRRIFDLLIKEKDDKIDSLQIRLQREGEHVQDVKMKIEELRMKIYSLRAQKKELHGKILAMQSTISSLKEEAKTLESTMEEQQNETRVLTEKCSHVKDQNRQVESLTQLLRHKEAEIEDLRHRIQLPASVGDPAKMTAEGSLKNNNSRFMEKESSVQAVEGRESENGSLAENAGVASGRVESEKLVNVGRRNGNMERNNKYDQLGERSNLDNTNTNSETESADDDAVNREQTPKDEISEAHARDGEGVENGGNIESISTSSSRGSDDPMRKGGVKLELENHDNTKSRLLKGYLKRSKGKRWSVISGDTDIASNSESDQVARTTIEDDHQVKKEAKSRDDATENTGENMEDSPPGNNTQYIINHINPENVNQNEAEQAAVDMSDQVKNSQQFTNTSAVNSHVSLEVPQQGNYGKTTESFNGGSEQPLQEPAESNEQDSIIRQDAESNTDIHDASQRTKAEIDENKKDDSKLENSEETETESRTSRESASSVEESNEEHGSEA